jgi:hypothetical protein
MVVTLPSFLMSVTLSPLLFQLAMGYYPHWCQRFVPDSHAVTIFTFGYGRVALLILNKRYKNAVTIQIL